MKADAIIDGEPSEDFGIGAMAAGDFDADGRTDLVVSSYAYGANAGRAYIFYNDGTYPTAAASADDIITGEAGSLFSYTMAVGDFNADGETDLAIGAIYYNTNVGRVYVFYNDGSYAIAAGSADVVITGEAGSYFGYSMTAGDFNTDGKIDLAVGASNYSTGLGRVYIFNNDGSYPTTATSAETIIAGEATSALFGRLGLTAGDFNSDGRTDLAVGAPSFNSQAGRAYIFYNDGSYPSTAATADVIISGESGSAFGILMVAGDFNGDGNADLVVKGNASNRGYVFYSQNGLINSNSNITGEASSYFGFSMVGGDFNADGKTDLAVGARGYGANTGRTYVFYSDSANPITAATADVIITGEASSYFGISLAAGDFNADGKTDLAVGANVYSSGTGRAYIFDQNVAGGFTTPLAAGSASVIISGEGTNNNFGGFLTAGDFNSDGTADLAIGARGYSSNAGRTYIFYNDGSIPTTAATADVIITGESLNNFFGISLAAGDFNSDGKTDLAVGASTYSSSGRVYVFYNDGTYPITAAAADAIITGEATNTFGISLAAGDFNSDGKTDLVVGSSSYGGSGNGRVYIFYDDGAYPTAADSADIIITGDASSSLGCSLVVGDFNDDGKTDLAVGGNTFDLSTGRTYIFYNDGSIPTTAATADVTIAGETTTNYFGYSLAAGDFNADGKTDLAIGAYGYGSNAGRVYFYQSRDRYAWIIQKQSLTDPLRDVNFAGEEMDIVGEANQTNFGISLEGGRFQL